MEKKIKILVVGDWVIDENWIVATDTFPTSSHVGKMHYRSRIKEVNAQILSLCGAGSVARLLHGLSKPELSKGERIDLFGLGIWEPGDTKYVSALFRTECPVLYQTPHTLQGMIKSGEESSKLENSNPLCHESGKHCLDCEDACKRLCSVTYAGSGTWRVLRVYIQTGSQTPTLLHRFDWEIEKYKEENKKHGFQEKINNFLNGKEFDIIVLVDHNKGGVTREIVNILKNTINDSARWYARTKIPDADWIDEIKDKLKLLVIGPMNLELKTDPWFYGYHISEGAIKWLWNVGRGDINGLTLVNNNERMSNTSGSISKIKFKFQVNNDSIPKYSVFAFHDDHNAVALINNPNEDPKLLIANEFPDPPQYKTGRTSVFFSYLIAAYESIVNINGNNIETLSKEILENALNCAYSWCKSTEGSLKLESFKDDQNLDFRKNYPTALSDIIYREKVKIRQCNLSTELLGWHEALNENLCGIVSPGPNTQKNNSISCKKKFQIWRGWSSIANYISLIENQKMNINKLKKSVKEFIKDPKPKRSLSILVTSNPGWGKSYLIESLANEMNLEYRLFNITRLTSINDLILCFDSIASIQSHKPDQPLMVFWDEINAKIREEHVFSYFLGPIWDGLYRRGGYKFFLKPCIWIFAGTKDEDEYLNSEKGSDFISRINGPKITLHKNDEENPDSKCIHLEQIYMAMSIITRLYPDVLIVSDLILEFFKCVKPKRGIRSLEFIISKLKNINHGTLNNLNLPRIDEIKELIINKREVDILLNEIKSKDEKLLRLYTNPPYDVITQNDGG